MPTLSNSNPAFLTKALATTRAFLAGDIVNNHPNPLRLALATRLHTIQSRTLHIPARLGFFSPPSSPPRLQVHQAWLFVHMVLVTCMQMMVGALGVVLLRVYGSEEEVDEALRRVAVGFLVIFGAQSVVFWGLARWGPGSRRGGGCEWSDGKMKMRKE